MAKIFLTGASGYLGGDVLHLLTKTHPEHKISVLVRDAAKAHQIGNVFKDIRIVQGDLDDTDILRQEVSGADVVLHLAAAGHLKSVQTIHAALAEAKREEPAVWIQISGASVLASGEIGDSAHIPGAESSLIFDDLDGIADIRSLIAAYPSRTVDNFVLNIAANAPQVNTALVFPPIIYGEGRGPVNQRSIQIPELARVTLQRKRGLQVGQGLNRWGDVHIRDLSELFLGLVEKAVTGDIDDGLWNRNGLYLTGVGELSFGDISKRVAEAAARAAFIPSGDVEQLDGAAADSLLFHGAVIFGTNARSNARRGKELLGWSPHHEGLDIEIPRVVQSEAQRLDSGEHE